MSNTHKSVRNIIGNEMGITREEVTRLVEARVDRLVSQWVAEHRLESLIDKRVKQVLDESVKAGRHDYRSMHSIATRAAEDFLRERLVVSFKEQS
jgi:hypothetical protein